MKQGLVILCSLLCIQVVYGLPDPSNLRETIAAVVQQEGDQSQPPMPQASAIVQQDNDFPFTSQVIEQNVEAEMEDAPQSPSTGNGMGFSQMLSAMMNGKESGVSAQVSAPRVPSGLRSLRWNVRLQAIIYNFRSDTILLWWVDYNGRPRCLASIRARGRVCLSTFGTHPSIITDRNGNVIQYFVPQTSNFQLVIRNGALFG